MDDVRIALICRALRRRLGWRQIDLALKSGVHQTTVSRIERGQCGAMPLDNLRAVFAALGARCEGLVQWRGGEVDRLLNQKHADLVEDAAAVYRADHWTILPEFSFSRFGERGSIDLLAVQPARRTAAINEMKASITAVDETLRRHDIKIRLAADTIEERLGWRPTTINRILIVPEESAIRSAIARHGATFDATYPARSREIRSWIRSPDRPLAGIWFLSPKRRASTKRVTGGAARVRVAGSSSIVGPGKAEAAMRSAYQALEALGAGHVRPGRRPRERA